VSEHVAVELLVNTSKTASGGAGTFASPEPVTRIWEPVHCKTEDAEVVGPAAAVVVGTAVAGTVVSADSVDLGAGGDGCAEVQDPRADAVRTAPTMNTKVRVEIMLPPIRDHHSHTT
jgi:hypothetical protein